MRRTTPRGPKLPSSLLDRLSVRAYSNSQNSYHRKHDWSTGQKGQRKALRDLQKGHRSQEHRYRSEPGKAILSSESPRSNQETSNEDLKSTPALDVKIKVSGSAHEQNPIPQERRKANSRQSDCPPLSLTVKAKLNEDDAEIAFLEKKLGLKGKKKRSRVFDDDFGDLLDGLDEYVDGTVEKRNRTNYNDFLFDKRKRMRTSDNYLETDSSDCERSSQEESCDLNITAKNEIDDSPNYNLVMGVKKDCIQEVEFRGFGELEHEALSHNSNNDDVNKIGSGGSTVKEEQRDGRRRENPYVPPVSAMATEEKYIPPLLRTTAATGVEDLTKLRRLLRGLVNRLSESNMPSILRDVENAYANNARQHVSTILVDLLLDILHDRTALMDTFIILHAGFAAATYKLIGAHFGAQLLERIVSDFDTVYTAELKSSSNSKETTNLIAFLAQLYTFQLVGSNVIFDYIRLFLADLSELNTELLLKIVRNCGPQLRHDDPSSLKDIVVLLQRSAAEATATKLPTRTKFMIETINDLKNNRQKSGSILSVAAEHTVRMKKILGTMNTRSKANEPLGVGLSDIRGSSKEGKWWLVGASWKNDLRKSSATTGEDHICQDNGSQERLYSTDFDTNFLVLAKEQRMNTDVRRTIFINILSASDYKDACMRLNKLKLKKTQELEIPAVLIHCAGAEKGYNPYYTLIAKQLCTEHRYKWAMQYCLWGLFRRMGEKNTSTDDSDGEQDNDDDCVDLRKIVNLGKMYGQLIADGALSLTSLKVLNFAYLQAKTTTFLEILLATALSQLSCRIKMAAYDSNSLRSVITTMFSSAKETPQVIMGLQLFLSRQMKVEDLGLSESISKSLREAIRVTKKVLSDLSTS
ncbi:uncharacterized protein PV09_05612 [Verruconis gallopava]|uniref:MI domain-containing protein n=1 Tax=Verruconis gallopava TaxID=253628 RepID=A0A0D1YQU6_9PEZI|nr:uncharacterized protein PV09_05612 [Verruconis gallopava]KIW02947.1 hypothetical protein PV09_05612 [Verruconis gallopava]